MIKTIAIIDPGECAGEMALVDEAPRSARVLALDDCTALRLGKDAYDSLRSSNPRLALLFFTGLSRMLSQRIRKINHIMETAQLTLFS